MKEVSENDNGAKRDETSLHNWVMANQRMAAALKAKGYPYRYVLAEGAGHTDGWVKRGNLSPAPWNGFGGDTSDRQFSVRPLHVEAVRISGYVRASTLRFLCFHPPQYCYGGRVLLLNWIVKAQFTHHAFFVNAFDETGPRIQVSKAHEPL